MHLLTYASCPTKNRRKVPAIAPIQAFPLRRIRPLDLLLAIGLLAGMWGTGCGQIPKSGTPPRLLLLRDEGLSQLSYVDVAHPENNWYVPVPAGRDLQLVGQNRVLIGTGQGYEERDLKTGVKVYEQNAFAGTVAARRLRNGNTLLVGLNWQGKSGIVLVEIDRGGSVKRFVVYPGFSYVRLVRETPTGTFLIASDQVVFEGRADGTIAWQATLSSRVKPQHAWQAQQLSDGRTIVSGGYSANLQVFDKNGMLTDSLSGPATVQPNFYAGFQILRNGNIAVANWQGHGTQMGGKGTQVLEYTPKGRLVWSWQQDPAKFSSIQGVIVLDGLDLTRLHIEDANGRLVPLSLP